MVGLGVVLGACGGSGASPSATTGGTGTTSSTGTTTGSSSSTGAGGHGTGGAGIGGAGGASGAGGAADAVQFLKSIDLPGAVAGMAYDGTAHALWVSTADPQSWKSTGLVAVDGTSDAVSPAIATDAVGDVAVLPALGKVYLAHGEVVGDAVVAVFDEKSKAEKTTITAAKAGGADWIAADPVTNRVFVFTDPFTTPNNQSSIVVIDGTTDTVVATVPVEAKAFTGLGVGKQIDVDTQHGKVWVVGGRNGEPIQAAELDEATNTVVKTTTVAAKGNPNGIAAIPATSNAAVVAHDVATGAGTLYLVDPLTVTLPAGFVPYRPTFIAFPGFSVVRIWGILNGKVTIVDIDPVSGLNVGTSTIDYLGNIDVATVVVFGEPIGSKGQTVYVDMIPDPEASAGSPPPQVQKLELIIK